MSDKQMGKFSKSNFTLLDVFQKDLKFQQNMQSQMLQKMEYGDLSDEGLAKWTFGQISNTTIYLAARNSSSSATCIVSLPSNGSVTSVPTASSNMAGSILRMQAKKISSSNFKVADNMLNERYIEKSE